MIRHDCRLYPAATLMEMSGRLELMDRRRIQHEPILINGMPISIRDQRPLHRGNMSLPDGYAFEAFVASLNRRVFFWPGTALGPRDHGVRHFGRYRSERPLIIRVRSSELLATNPRAVPLFCKYNSGSPRCSYGTKSPRGPNTFMSADDFQASPGQVVEVTFEASIVLPADSEYGPAPTGPWRPLM